MEIYEFQPGRKLKAEAPLRLDFVGMSDFFPARGCNVNATLCGLSAQLFATFREDDLVEVQSGEHGSYSATLEDIYEHDALDTMFSRALKLYPECQLGTGVNVNIDCQYGAGGLSTSSSVAAAMHAFLQLIFDQPANPMGTVWKVIQTEPHCYGRQDQLAAVFGGINMWEMEPEDFDFDNMTPDSFDPGNIRRKPIYLSPVSFSYLKEVVMVYESGIREGASTVLRDVALAFRNDREEMQRRFDGLSDLALEVRETLAVPYHSAEDMANRLGRVLNKVRVAHTKLHPDMLNHRMIDLLETAMNAGATGGRINGAGRRGTIQLIVPPHLQAEVHEALNQVDTPGPDGRKKLHGELIRHGGFGAPGASCHLV